MVHVALPHSLFDKRFIESFFVVVSIIGQSPQKLHVVSGIPVVA